MAQQSISVTSMQAGAPAYDNREAFLRGMFRITEGGLAGRIAKQLDAELNAALTGPMGRPVVTVDADPTEIRRAQLRAWST